MADSDYEYDGHDDDHDDVNIPGSRGSRGRASRPKQAKTQAWEAAASKNWDLQEGADGSIESVLGGLEEANKRKRLLKDTTPLQRGIIRHTLLILDLSTAMAEKDLRPTRFLLTISYTIAFVTEFFEQNPISQLGILGMRDGVAVRISEMSGNPNDHITAVKALRGTDPKGNPSLQNALEMARAALYHTPSHGTREVVIVLGALLSSDPGDIHDTIRSCVKDKIRVNIIGLAARMHICTEIVRRTNGGDDSGYNVAVDEVSYRELLMGITTPPVVRATDKEMQERNNAALLMMGFPSRVLEETPTLCACHGNLTRGGYLCSRCKAKVCGLPATCPTCDLTLILSTHLARSYHHLFPLMNWVEVSWERARQKRTTQCYGCLSPFPAAPSRDSDRNGTTNGVQNGNVGDKAARRTRAEGASESSRYECEVCQKHFCIDCDVFCHEVVHNCPGCQSNTHLPGAGSAGGAEGHVNGGG
ncbi:TFIIH basal transcription factor complex, subunit SSL1 [Myriangium duriaei CBS 260.36]|uniref:General transcription and DNA repair factor IIH n=1 Tax=Myriangium duriaei CBS 260.36 TaxID=1168546 RepID=A0A9P4J784_9PEZI|nr:TFIIH basal transcription factor complex, subunit SSL1 [Myriangium duriaei CBS 260.36]